jgi:hypothetical protein
VSGCSEGTDEDELSGQRGDISTKGRFVGSLLSISYVYMYIWMWVFAGMVVVRETEAKARQGVSVRMGRGEYW